MTSWKQVKTFSEAEGPCPRWGHAMCEINDQIYIFGGYESKILFIQTLSTITTFGSST